jgi:DNA-directed RNA polymerases I, II, and III subunit RPABC1
MDDEIDDDIDEIEDFVEDEEEDLEDDFEEAVVGNNEAEDEEEEEEVNEEEEEEETLIEYDNYSVELGTELGRTKRNILVMLKDRGIKLSADEEILLQMDSLDIFCKCLNNQKKNYFSNEYQLQNKKSILVHFIVHSQKKKVCVDEIKEIFKKKYFSYIIIVPDKLSFDSNIEIQKHKNVQIFTYDYFLFPVAHHAFVPKHVKLTENEKKEFLKVRNISLDQLPILRDNDPIVKYYGWDVGEIIKIERPGNNFYRVIK